MLPIWRLISARIDFSKHAIQSIHPLTAARVYYTSILPQGHQRLYNIYIGNDSDKVHLRGGVGVGGGGGRGRGSQKAA